MLSDTVLKRLLGADLTGDKLTGLFTDMANMMILSDAAQASLVLGYVDDLRELQPGDFIPTITMSLTRYTEVKDIATNASDHH